MVQRSLDSSNQSSIVKVIQHLIETGCYFAIYSKPFCNEVQLIVENTGTASEGFLIQTFDNEFYKIKADLRYTEQNLNEVLQQHLIRQSTSVTAPSELLNSKKSFTQYVAHIVDLCHKQQLNKVVASGRIQKNKTANFNIGETFMKALLRYPSAMVHLSFSPFGCWFGATPEILVQAVDGNKYSTMSLAGTRKKSDQRKWTEKELEEQRIVTRVIEQGLISLECTNLKIGTPKAHSAGAIEHIKSSIDFESNLDIKLIAKELHPTPAVGGNPRKQALEVIRQFEKNSRMCYTGFLGPVTNEDKSLYVNLRCMQILNKSVVLFVGAGITKDSDPFLEWEEIQAKANTLLQII